MRQFAMSLDYSPQGLSEICNERRDVTIELIRRATEIHDLSPNFIFTGEGAKFRAEADSGLGILTIVTDQEDNERIVHVPVSAQAGYASSRLDPVFVQDLPSYSLPYDLFKMGTYRSFDITGESMEPTLFEKDKVVCSFIEKDYWRQAIKDYQMYVLVMQDDVLVKRVVNQIREKNVLHLVSDNQHFDPYDVPLSDVEEIWKVRLKISSHLDPQSHAPQLKNDIGAVQDEIAHQREIILSLKESIDQMSTANNYTA